MGLAIFSATNIGSNKKVRLQGGAYAAVHNAANGSNLGITPVCWNYYNTTFFTYSIDRGFLDFDTTTLPGAIAGRFAFRVSGKTNNDPGHSDFHIVQGIQNIPLLLSDYGAHLIMTTSGGSMAYAAIGIGGANTNVLTLNANGISWVVPGGITKFCLRLSGDIDNLVPTDGNVVNLDLGGAWSGAVTNPASGVLSTSATLNGTFRAGTAYFPFLEVTYVGADPILPRVRFEYGLTIAYGQVTPWQYGTPMFSDFADAIGPLVPATLYHFRAVCEDASGTDNGVDRTFTTLAPAIPFVINKAYALAREEL